MTCSFAQDDGAYVLGALSAAERLAFERHLAGCQDCTTSVRELAGLPGLLGRVDLSVLEDPPVDEPVPDTLLPSLSRDVRRARRRRTVTTAGLAAAAALVVAGVPLVVAQVGGDDGTTAQTTQSSPTPAASSPRPMDPVGDVPVQASLALQPVLWGTRLDLTCTYESDWVEYDLPPVVTYALYVRTRDGHAEQVGTWRSVDGRTMQLSAATAASQADIRSVEVRTADGRVVLRLDA